MSCSLCRVSLKTLRRHRLIPHIHPPYLHTAEQMQMSKVACVDALNDSSGGKKSKRRSKQERKQMVETFVNRHQSSNNGSFPTLHLTHKEVGGSYYTVREIFQELIHKNRVLAPPKLPPGEQKMENLDSLLSSVSFDPNVHGLSPKDNQTLVKDKFINSKRVPEMHRQNLDNDDLINGSNHATMKSEDIVEPEHAELLMGQALDGHKGGTEEVESREGQIRHLSEDVVVETFPLRPVSNMVYDVDVKTTEKELLDGNLEKEATINSNAAVDTVENNALSSKHLDSNKSSSSLQHATFEETTADKYKLEMQPGDTVQKQTADATSNEINIESCEAAAAATKKSVSQETNPIKSFMKTVAAAFVKFWS